jgi:exonuclease VII small subunit
MKLYAEGAALIRECRRTLGEAEKRISKLTEAASGELSTEPFEVAAATEEAGEKGEKAD